ncbi:MAG: aminotransferase class I/II-fold pyridoxal phosphate-dependent enzyme [Anaerolineaceae bacterium]|nr:aminotransferase class I/II-fold pyridoxal phosphate-dependent enzyme [Anaerolineaceae bacterium]
MDISKKISKAVHVGKLYNLDHFHQAWEKPTLHRLMGNELLYSPSKKVIEAVQAILPYMNYYPEDPSTNKRLLSALAEYVGIDGGADWITLGNGSMEIIDMLPRTFIDPGDEILLPCPDYSPYSRRPPLFGGVIVDVKPDENFIYSLEDFTSKLTERTKMIILSRPNAPAGNLLVRDILEALCQLDVIVVVDEAYAEFSQQSVVDLLPRYSNLIISRTFSKAMGLGGIRLGFVIAHPEVIEYVNRIRVPLNVSLITQTVALAALEDADYIHENVMKVIHTRDWFISAVDSISGIHAFPSQGNAVLLNCEGTGKTAEDFKQELLSNGYLTRNLSGGRGMRGDYFLRITVGQREDMKRVAAILSAFASQ